MKLKELRLKHHLIQQELANILNIPKSTYVKYELESTQAPIEIYIKLANYYNVTLDYLLENPKPPRQESEFTLKEEELIDMYRELSEQNKEVILRNFYILLNPDARQNYEILKYIK